MTAKYFVKLITTALVALFTLQAYGEGMEFLGKVRVPHSANAPILGISSIRYNPGTDSYILLSDDTGTLRNSYGEIGEARYYNVPASAIWQHDHLLGDWKDMVSEVMIQPNDSITWISSGHIDTESVALHNRDGLLISSEGGATYPFDLNLPFIHWPEWTVTPSVIHVSSQGHLLGQYFFPEYYEDKRFKFDLPFYNWASEDPDRAGLLRNKGFEALDHHIGSNYVAITEAPLQQDSKVWNKANGPAPSRMIHFSVDKLDSGDRVKLTREHFYQHGVLPKHLTADAKPGYPRNGITDIQVINQDYALVLERNLIHYQNKKPRSVTDIYRVRLGSSINFAGSAEFPKGQMRQNPNNMMLNKTLIFRSTSFSERVPEFDSLNMEGLTFGPNLPDGGRVLVLVNDNDASSKKPGPTWMIFFRVPQTLLQD